LTIGVLLKFKRLPVSLWKNLPFWGNDFSRWKWRCQCLAYFEFSRSPKMV